MKYVRTFSSDFSEVGTPLTFATAQSDRMDEFDRNSPFGDQCRKYGTQMDMSPGNRDAERAFALIKRSPEAARMQASRLYCGIEIPNHDWLWEEGFNYSVDCFNRSVYGLALNLPMRVFTIEKLPSGSCHF